MVFTVLHKELREHHWHVTQKDNKWWRKTFKYVQDVFTTEYIIKIMICGHFLCLHFSAAFHRCSSHWKSRGLMESSQYRRQRTGFAYVCQWATCPFNRHRFAFLNAQVMVHNLYKDIVAGWKQETMLHCHETRERKESFIVSLAIVLSHPGRNFVGWGGSQGKTQMWGYRARFSASVNEQPWRCTNLHQLRIGPHVLCTTFHCPPLTGSSNHAEFPQIQNCLV